MDRPVTADDAAGTGVALAEVILYVADQAASAAFYRALLGRPPRLDGHVLAFTNGAAGSAAGAGPAGIPPGG